VPQQNVNGLPSVGRFVGDIGQKTAKTTTIFKPISPTLDFFLNKKIGMAGTADTWSIIQNSAARFFFCFVFDI